MSENKEHSFRKAPSLPKAALAFLIMTFFFLAVNSQAMASSNAGKILFESNRDGNLEIYVMNAYGAGQTRLTNSTENEIMARWSPDGSRIVFDRDNSGNREIYVMNADGTGQTNLTVNAADDISPAWSPDGSKIAFASYRDGNWEIYVMNADGSGLTRLTTNGSADNYPAWSPDGSRIAFTSDRNGNFEIYAMYATGNSQIRLTNNAATDYSPDWSPDGAKIAFESDRDGNNEVYVMNADGTGQTRLTLITDFDGTPAWSPDGSRIAFTSNRNGNYEIYVMNADGTGQQRLTNNTDYDVNPDWRPTKNYFFTWYDNIGGDNWVLMSSPAGGSQLTFTLGIGGLDKDLSTYGYGVIGGGHTISPRYAGLRAGPVVANSMNGDKGIVSQRILWPSGGNSLEEVPGTDAGRLSSHFYWTWYDESAGSGFKNWILIANPQGPPVNPSSRSVYYRIKIDGVVPAGGTGTITAGQNTTPRFPGLIGGPVEVEAWYDAVGGTQPAVVMASQRVLSNSDRAFNEVPGIANEDLATRHIWTWYDMTGSSRNWVLIANPATKIDGVTPSDYIYYEIWLAGTNIKEGGPIAPGGHDTPFFPGTIGGPVEVRTFSDPAHTTLVRSIASQRSLWGPSFEEVPGYPFYSLASKYHWTWYDQNEGPGVTNWVLIANAGASDVTATVKVGGLDQWSGTVPANGGRVTPTFAGLMGGPVEVTASGPVMASQRVLWNGYFNEVLGTVLD